MIRPVLFLIILLYTSLLSANDGYKLWLDFKPLSSIEKKQYIQYTSLSYDEDIVKKDIVAFKAVEVLNKYWATMNGRALKKSFSSSKNAITLYLSDDLDIHKEGFEISSNNNGIYISARSGHGLLYGVYHFLQTIQKGKGILKLKIKSEPRINLRLLNHWDNLDRTIERGYAGFSIFNWHELPDIIDPRYEAYAEANASIGINGVVLTNVNANALILRKDYLDKVEKLADIFRPYGVKVYLTARFSAPIEEGKMTTADPLHPDVQAWWNQKVNTIYSKIPDFGGFVVKANSEGQPGPQQYNRNHADGANMLAKALKPHGGVVMWRAFVYSADIKEDRIKQAYNEFMPLDGKFEDNVIIQVKNGPLDFQPREPFHPLFGGMQKTPLMMEFQITKEYLGQANHLVGLAEMWQEVLNTDTYAKGPLSTMDKVIDGSLHNHKLTAIAGVSNVGNDRNWTGHIFNQADWFAYGRLAWDPTAKSVDIYSDWIDLTIKPQPDVKAAMMNILNGSHEMLVNYMTPLGLVHIMAEGHHYGPGPWVDSLNRADWTAVYYHKATKDSIGFNRTSTGSNAVNQYHKIISDKYANIESCPEEYLLWFHRVSWSMKLKSARTLWEEMVFKYDLGVSQVRDRIKLWNSLQGKVDNEIFIAVSQKLQLQFKEASWWRNACLSYFQSINGLPFPHGTASPPFDLAYYKSLSYPYAPGIRPRW
jgi:alpha-glucuronidase